MTLITGWLRSIASAMQRLIFWLAPRRPLTARTARKPRPQWLPSGGNWTPLTGPSGPGSERFLVRRAVNHTHFIAYIHDLHRGSTWYCPFRSPAERQQYLNQLANTNANDYPAAPAIAVPIRRPL